MVRLTRKRTALALYLVLLVLPTLVLGGLDWYQLPQEQRARLAAVPLQVRNAAQRLSDAIAQRLEALVETEERRGFEQYREQYYPLDPIGADLVFVPSPLVSQPPPKGILAWFSWHMSDDVLPPYELLRYEGESSEGEAALEWAAVEPGLRASVARLIEHDYVDGFFRLVTRASNLRMESVPLSFAAANTSKERDATCMLAEKARLVSLAERNVLVPVYDFHLRFYREEDGTPRIVATRPIPIEPQRAVQKMPECFRGLANGVILIQGFFIDPAWLFGEVPTSASGVLEGSAQFIPAGQTPSGSEEDLEVETIRPVEELGFETYTLEELDYGALQVAISTRELKNQFRRQMLRFFGVAAMLTLSLSTGLVLLLRSVRRELEQAEQSENFVAAVTHELRTPVSAIRLYGEMLRDGWAKGPEKVQEYHERIVLEAQRLETLVERVLEKAELHSSSARPQPADLNTWVRPIVDELVHTNGSQREDLALELAANLPPALLRQEALGSIVVNLVENARKYAPARREGAAPDDDGIEPILVRTRLRKGQPVLEVLDRGPGIPNDEKARVFDAFYRIGNEATRTSRGTGLGLHLVASQAEALGGFVEVADRPGGGSVFRVGFRSAGKAVEG